MEWNWKDSSFDFVHLRYLFGAIKDWPALMKQAYRVTQPGGWVESCEADVDFVSDDDTVAGEPVLATWAQLYRDAGVKTQTSFAVIKEDLQKKALTEAGFEDIQVVNYKVCARRTRPLAGPAVLLLRCVLTSDN